MWNVRMAVARLLCRPAPRNNFGIDMKDAIPLDGGHWYKDGVHILELRLDETYTQLATRVLCIHQHLPDSKIIIRCSRDRELLWTLISLGVPALPGVSVEAK